LSPTDKPISFAQHIKPLFREGDRESMKWEFDLWSHDDVAGNSDAILARLRDGTMPCDGAWPDEQVAVFQSASRRERPPERAPARPSRPRRNSRRFSGRKKAATGYRPARARSSPTRSQLTMFHQASR
jgi:hypothetical protein